MVPSLRVPPWGRLHRGAATPAAHVTGTAAGEKVHGHQVPELWSSRQGRDILADLDHPAGGLVARGDGIDRLGSIEQASLHGAQTAGAHLHEHIVGTGCGPGLVAELDRPRSGDDGNLHDAPN